jgi:hypothetical protein
MKNWGRILSLIMAGEDLVISLAYFFQGNYRMGLYWLLAAGLTTTIAW